MSNSDHQSRVDDRRRSDGQDLPQPATRNRLTLAKPWHLTARLTVTYWDRLRMVVGVPLYIRFTSPDGACHAACNLTVAVQRDWPEGEGELKGKPTEGFPPLVPACAPLSHHGSESRKPDVYSRPECVFTYCDNPESCRPVGWCRHKEASS